MIASAMPQEYSQSHVYLVSRKGQAGCPSQTILRPDDDQLSASDDGLVMMMMMVVVMKQKKERNRNFQEVTFKTRPGLVREYH